MSSEPRLPLVPASYVAVLRSHGSGEEILLHLRQGTGFRDGWWAAPAGHVDAGESAVACAVRELREEVGIVAEAHDLEPLTAMQRTDGSLEPVEQRIDFFYALRRWTAEPRIMEPGKCADLQWFALDALPDTVVAHERFVYESMAAGRLAAVTTWGFETHARAR